MPPPRALDFAGDVAIVTGAGSRMSGEIGNGRATAILLARHGAQVALVDMDRAWATETKRMIDDEREEEEEEGYDDGSSSSSSSSASHGGGAPSSRPSSSRCEVIQADVTDEDACRAVVERTVARFGAVHILVNNVGVGGAMGDATTVDVGPGPGGWDRGWRVNVTSMVLMCRYAVPEMRRAGRGAVVNMSSVSGMVGGNPSLLYATTKGAIIQMTRAMAAHYGADGIRVNCVAPGMVYTPMVRGGGMSDEVRRRRSEENLLKTEGTAWDVGYAVLFLSSKEARWITGHTMVVDAGATAAIPGRPVMLAGSSADDDKVEQGVGRDSKL